MFIVSEDNMQAVNSKFITNFHIKSMFNNEAMEYHLCAITENGKEIIVRSTESKETAQTALIQLLEMLA